MALPARRGDDDLTRWDPFAELNRVSQQLQQYLGEWPRALVGDAFTPLADVEETDDAFVVEVELPGVSRDDVEVELTGRRVTVSGERKERERAGVLRRRTRTVGRFHYEVLLPGDVEEEGIEATLEEGVLSVRVPKAERERARRIPVK